MTAPVDGVEIKYTLSGTQLDAALGSFALRPEAAKRQVVHFFDTIDPAGGALRLLPTGLVLRLRRKARGSGRSTLKLRPARPERLTGDWAAGSARFDDYSVEYDWGRSPVLAASMGADAEEDRIDAVLRGDQPVRTLFSADQEAFLAACGSPPPHPFDGLRLAGPITALRWDDVAVEGGAGLRAERWEYGGGRSFLELSVRVDDVQVARRRRTQLGDELARRGLVADSASRSKTETVLRDLLGI